MLEKLITKRRRLNLNKTNMTKIITRRQEHLLTLWMFKYYPIIGSLIMWLYVFLLVFDNHLIFKHNVTSDSFIGMMSILFLMVNFVMIFVSDVLSFCWLHRAAFAFMGLVGSCISYEYFIGFGILLLPSRIFVLIIGALLHIYLIIHWKGFVKCHKIIQ